MVKKMTKNQDFWKQQYPNLKLLRRAIFNELANMLPASLRLLCNNILDGKLKPYKQNILTGQDTKDWANALIELYDTSPRTQWLLMEAINDEDKEIANNIASTYDQSTDDLSSKSSDQKAFREELSGGDSLDQCDYSIENFDWGKKETIPQPTPRGQDEISKLQDEVEVLLVTAVPTERDAVLRLLKPYPGSGLVLEVSTDPICYLGQFGAFKTAVVMCEVGALGLNAAFNAVQKSLTTWQPLAVIMVGIAFGKSPKKQKIGDILVSHHLIPYDAKRVEAAITQYTASRPDSDPILRNLFRAPLNWKFERPDGKNCTAHEPGTILTGGTLLDNLDEKVKLFTDFPNAIGGEMEGAGLYAAAVAQKTPWIVIKAISDWADGKKNERRSHRDVAAAAAAHFVHYVLSNQFALDELKKSRQ
ncbi:MAG: hypothetical protein B0A82_18980 [Alkalinema sp. CACIAM 70d]|nr:MAG: hypothetical protein B0A82_18980 [Alkalinema sp. CACIAM 70d]